jgi:hypothetical protein
MSDIYKHVVLFAMKFIVGTVNPIMIHRVQQEVVVPIGLLFVCVDVVMLIINLSLLNYRNIFYRDVMRELLYIYHWLPALLWAGAGVLIFMSISSVGPVVPAVLGQLRLPVSLCLSRLCLKKTYSRLQYISVCVLTTLTIVYMIVNNNERSITGSTYPIVWVLAAVWLGNVASTIQQGIFHRAPKTIDVFIACTQTQLWLLMFHLAFALFTLRSSVDILSFLTSSWQRLMVLACLRIVDGYLAIAILTVSTTVVNNIIATCCLVGIYAVDKLTTEHRQIVASNVALLVFMVLAVIMYAYSSNLTRTQPRKNIAGMRTGEVKIFLKQTKHIIKIQLV